MTVTVNHVYTAANLSAANPTISVTDTPAAGDVLVLVSGNAGAVAITAVSGCGATWQKVTGFTSNSNIVEAWVGTGATSSGTVTASTPSTSNRALEVLMVSGLSNAATGVTVFGTGTQTTAAQTAGAGQLVIGAGWSDNSADSLTTLVPSTGWTVNRTGMATDTQYIGVGYRTPASSDSHTTAANRTGGSNTFVSQMVLGGTRANLHTDPSAEGAGIAWTAALNTPTVARSTAKAWAGTASYAFTAGASGSSEAVTPTGTAGFPVAASKPYVASFYSLAATTVRSCAIQINWYTSTGTFISGVLGSLAADSTTVWTRRSVALTSPTNAAYASIQVRYVGPAAGEVHYMDGFLLESSNVTGNYFDGASTQAGYTYAWTGTANASTSTETPSAGGSTPISSALSGSGTLTSGLVRPARTIASGLSGSGTLASKLLRQFSSGFSGSGTLSSALTRPARTLASGLSGSGTLSSALTRTRTIASGLSGSGTLSSSLVRPARTISSSFSGSGTLTSHIGSYIQSGFSGSGTLTSALSRSARTIASALSGSATLTSDLARLILIDSAFTGTGTLTSVLSVPVPPEAPVEGAPLGKLVSFNVSTAAVKINPAEGSGASPSVSAVYTKGFEPEFALGGNNVLTNGAVGTYEGEVVRLNLPENSGNASISTATPLTSLNTELHLRPFIDSDPGTWTAVRAIDYWTQMAGLFYDKVPGQCIAYASGFGHTDSFGAGTTFRFYEKLTGGTTATQVINSRSVKTFGAEVTGVTALHEAVNGRVTASLPLGKKLVFSIGVGLAGTGRTAKAVWKFRDTKEENHTVALYALSDGTITAKIGGSTIASASVPSGAAYRLTLSLERLSDTSLRAKLTVLTDDLAGTGTLEYDGTPSTVTYSLPGVLKLRTIEHVSTGGSGAQMTRWGTYLSVADGHPMELPAVQKVLAQTGKSFSFVSGFQGNVWNLLNEFCAIARLDVRFIGAAMQVSRRIATLSHVGPWATFTADSQRREKWKQVAVVNKQSKAVSTDDAVLWRSDSVIQVAAREVYETTVQTPHSILSVLNPVPVDGILPFPYKQGAGQYVVTGADGYIVAPAWWTDNGGKVEVALTDKEGEISLKITAPGVDSVRAPYRISEGAADRPALYVSGSGIINDPKEVHIATGAKNAREGFDNVFESPFISGLMETYDTAMAMAMVYSSSVADVTYELPNPFDSPTGLGQYPSGSIVTDNSRNYRIMNASQTSSKVSGNAVPHTTIAAYVASYPPGATIADEKARHAGRTIRQFNIKPLKGNP